MDGLIGNKRVKQHLKKIVDQGKIGNSLLFAGQEGVGKGLFAYAMAQMIVKTDREYHPDIHILRPEGKLCLHSIDSMRSFANEVNMPPYTSDHKVFIIHDAHCMLPASANALLKTFEEPSSETVIILVTHHPELLLPTIISRCCKIDFQPVKCDEIATFLENHWKLSKEKALAIANRSMGNVSRAVRLIKEGSDEKHEALIQMLINGPFTDYNAFIKAIDHLVDVIEKDSRYKDVAKNEYFTAIQRETWEKEALGMATGQFISDMDGLFETILSWYRDLHLLHLEGSLDYLFHGDRRAQLRQSFVNCKLLSLDFVQHCINEAQLALRRSTKLSVCLESLFIKLDLLV